MIKDDDTHLMAIFQDNAGTRMSPFWLLLKLRITEVVVTTGAIRHPVKTSPPTNQHPSFLQAGRPSYCHNQQCQCTEGKKYDQRLCGKKVVCFSAVDWETRTA